MRKKIKLICSDNSVIEIDFDKVLPPQEKILRGDNCLEFIKEFFLNRNGSVYLVSGNQNLEAKMQESGIYFLTSGSSTKPKLIKKNFENLFNEAKDLAEVFNIPSDYVFVTTTTPVHLFGLTFQVMFPSMFGCAIDTERVFYPEDIKEYENYVLISTPSFLEKMYKYQQEFKNPPKYIFSAGAKLKDEVFAFFEKKSKVVEIYGSTETGVVGYRTESNAPFIFFNNVSYKKLDDDVIISSPYFPEDTYQLTDNKEFVDNGFNIVGRNDRLVKIQEKRVSLPKLEEVLINCEYLSDAYCLKIDDKLCAAVVLSDIGINKFIKECKNSLISEFKKLDIEIMPKKWRFLHELPVDERGKIDAKRIKEIFNTNFSYPIVVHNTVAQDIAEYELIFPKNSNFFEGHFTGVPILPGVVQLFVAKDFIKSAFHLDFVPEKIKRIKFSSIIKPDMQVKLSLRKKESSVDYKFTKGDICYSSGSFEL